MPTHRRIRARAADWATSSTTRSSPPASACRPATAAKSRYANDTAPPNATQIKLSDGVNPFDADALAEGVTVQKLNYDEIAFDAGFKFRGFSFQSEYYVRKLSDFRATGGPVALESIVDQGFQVQAMHMVVPRLVGLYATYGKVFDDFDRNPWEISGGVSVLPERDPQLAAEPPPHKDREEPGCLELRVLHLGPERHDHFDRDGHPAVRRPVL